MGRLFIPTAGPSDWRRLLADSMRQWRPEKSGYEAAVSWEAARGTPRGLPPKVAEVLDGHEEFRNASLLLGIPEHQVPLDGGGHASQTDLWALLATPGEIVSVAVEAKAGEPFDRTTAKWISEAPARSGKPARLTQLCQVLGIEREAALSCSYQLLHRPVAAILEAQRFRLRRALFMVQAFGENKASFIQYERWARLLGVDATQNTVHRLRSCIGVELWTAWICAQPAEPAIIRAAV